MEVLYASHPGDLELPDAVSAAMPNDFWTCARSCWAYISTGAPWGITPIGVVSPSP